MKRLIALLFVALQLTAADFTLLTLNSDLTLPIWANNFFTANSNRVWAVLGVTNLTGKVDAAGGTASGLTLVGTTVVGGPISVNSTTISTNELSYLDGATGNLQAQINAIDVNGYLPTTNATAISSFTLNPGTVTGRTNVVRVAPYQTINYTAGDFGPNSGETSFEFVNVGNAQRLRQTGTLQRVKVSVAATNNVTGFYVKVWRKVASNNYSLVGTSENLLSQLSAGGINTLDLSSTIAAQLGDYVGIRVTYSSASAQMFNSEVPAGNTATIYSISNATADTTGYAWESQTAAASQCVVVECYMTAPVFVAIGDSIMSGNSGTVSLIDASVGYVANESIPELLSLATGWTGQNMAISGEEVGSDIVPRFTNDVLNLYPRIALLQGGVNDLRAGTNAATVQAAYDILLAACVANSIKPVVIGVMPFRAATSTDNTKLQSRDTLNATLEAATVAAGGIYVDPDDYIGQFYAGGDADNRWLLDDLSDPGDGLHLTMWGRMRIVQAVLDAIAQLNVRGVVSAGSLSVGSSIEFNGQSQATITGGRSESVNGTGGRLSIKAGGAGRNSTNTAGGSLFLQSGESTGTGTSSVRIQSPTPGSSGALDSTIETRATFNNSGVHFTGDHFALGTDTTAPDERFGIYYGGDAGNSTASVGLYLLQNVATAAALTPSLFWGTLSIDSAVTQPSASGIRVQNPIGSGTLNNFAGLWVLPLSKGTSANTSLQLGGSTVNTSGSYLIYGAETNASYFTSPYYGIGIAPDKRYGLYLDHGGIGNGTDSIASFAINSATNTVTGNYAALGAYLRPSANFASGSSLILFNAGGTGAITNFASLLIPAPTKGTRNTSIAIGPTAAPVGNYAIYSTVTNASEFTSPFMSFGTAADARFGLNYQAAPTGDGNFVVGLYLSPKLASAQSQTFAGGWIAPVVNSGVNQRDAVGLRISNASVSGTLTNYSSLWIPEPTSGSAANAAIQLGGANVITSGNWALYSSITNSAYFAGNIELGSVSDTTLSRSAAGVLAVEGVNVATVNDLSTIQIPASAMSPFVTNGATAVTTTLTGIGLPIDEYSFDASTDKFVAVKVTFPPGWNGTTLTATFKWRTTATSGNCVWGIQARYARDGDNIDTTFGTAVTITDGAQGTANYQSISSATGTITPSGTFASGCSVYFIIYRDADNGSDTLASAALLDDVILTWK